MPSRTPTPPKTPSSGTSSKTSSKKSPTQISSTFLLSNSHSFVGWPPLIYSSRPRTWTKPDGHLWTSMSSTRYVPPKISSRSRKPYVKPSIQSRLPEHLRNMLETFVTRIDSIEQCVVPLFTPSTPSGRPRPRPSLWNEWLLEHNRASRQSSSRSRKLKRSSLRSLFRRLSR